MRVISGLKRGMRLLSPEGREIRPTSDRIKENLFNILQFKIAGARVLDLFAGTGALGIEALSRGADEVIFCDTSPKAIEIVRKNLELTGLKGRVEKSDALSLLKTLPPESIDIIFADPPFGQDLWLPVFTAVIKSGVLKTGGVICFEHDSHVDLSADLQKQSGMEGKISCDVRRYGSTTLTIATRV